ncbi:MAG: DUF983 domain-containing protein [Bryobacteraceae bacterium]
MAPRTLAEARPPFRVALRRGLSLRCPCCGRGPLYVKVLRMYPECPLCELRYYREPGYYVGAMILNYGVTAFLLISAYLISLFLPEYWHTDPQNKILAWMAAAVVVSLALVTHTRSLWLAVDYWVEPWEPAEPIFRSSEKQPPADRKTPRV